MLFFLSFKATMLFRDQTTVFNRERKLKQNVIVQANQTPKT